MAVPARAADEHIALTYRGARGLRGVRFHSELTKRGEPPAFRRLGRSHTWELQLPRPLGVGLDQCRVERLQELAPPDVAQELLQARVCGRVAVPDRELEPLAQDLAVARAREAEGLVERRPSVVPPGSTSAAGPARRRVGQRALSDRSAHQRE